VLHLADEVCVKEPACVLEIAGEGVGVASGDLGAAVLEGVSCDGGDHLVTYASGVEP
jgi:hypothetical protein